MDNEWFYRPSGLIYYEATFKFIFEARMAFYRKWRPQSFGDVCGQEHIKKTLENAIKERKVGHAYLFCGPRGTGKTTMARLLAKSLNCEKVDYKSKNELFEPCNECPSCREIAAGQSLDVIEIDAASNRGIEEIRELREKVKFAPVRSPFKVFIIDEVHMLTREAFNALLKTLEEPPRHAIFILATTEPHKILATIISRCQRYDFHKGNLNEISNRLSEVAKEEKLKLDDQARKLIARMADGSFRDALSLLDQISSVSGAKSTIMLQDVQMALGLADQEGVKQFFSYLADGDTAGIVGLLGQMVESGAEMVTFCNQMIDRVRNMVLIKSGVEKEIIAYDWTEEEWIEIANSAIKFQIGELIDLLNGLVKAANDIKRSPIAQMPLEIMAIEWMQNYGKLFNEGKKVTIAYDEPIKVQDLVKMPVEESAPVNVDAVSQPTEEKQEDGPGDHSNIWVQITEKVRPQNHSLYTVLKDASLRLVDQEKAVVGVRFRFHSERMYDRKNRKMIEDAIEAVCGKNLRLECVVDDKMPKPESVENQDLMSAAVEVFGME